MNGTLSHRHGVFTHEHHHHGPHRHARLPFKSFETTDDDHHHHHDHDDAEHGHAHGLVDPSIVRSRAGVRAVGWSLAILGVVASAALVAIGIKIADPLIGLAITALILRITLQAWQTIRAAKS